MNSKTTFRLLWSGYFILTLFWITRFWEHFPAFMDTMEYVFPEKWFNVESFQNGRIPLWNPYIACGTPHVANLQSAAFYPLFWLWNLTGLTNWFFAAALFHGVLAAVGFYLWLRSLKVSSLPATLCALSFSGSALLVNYWGFPTHLASVAWVPWIFWGTVRLLRQPSAGAWGIVAAFWALQLLAGYPFFSFYAFLLLWVCLLWQWKAAGKMVFIHFSAFLAALGLTACQWLPFVDFMGYLHREGWGESLFSLRWINYQTLLQPDLLGIPGTAAYRGDYPNFIFNNLYLGIIPLAFFIGSFFSPKLRDGFWKNAALFWFFWLAGVHFFVWKIFPERWLDKVEPSKSSFLFIFCVFTALGLFLQAQMDLSSKNNWFRKWSWLWGAIWILDLILVPFRIVHVIPDPYQNPEVARTAAKARQMTGEGREVSLRDQSQYYSASVTNLSDSFVQTAEDLVPNTNVIWGLKSARGYLSVSIDGYQNFVKYLQQGYPYDGRVLDAAGVNLILFPHNLPAFKYHVYEPVGHLIFTRNAGAMSDAWETSEAREFENRPAVFEALLSPKAFLENEVYTEKTPEGKAVLLAPSKRTLSGVAGVSWWDKLTIWARGLWEENTTIQEKRLSPCEIQFQVSSTHRGFLVFNESFAPGWHAWVDGIPEAIFRADGLGMAVLFKDAGAHQVFFRYEPTSFRLGLFVSLICFVLGLLFFVFRIQKTESKHRFFQ